jgi:hypothetical protein
MSWVTDVVLFYGLEEDEADEDGVSPCLAGINRWLREHDHQELVNVDEHLSVGKPMQANVWGGAFNFLNIEKFLESVKAQTWQAPENVQIMVKDEEEARFTLYHLTDIG